MEKTSHSKGGTQLGVSPGSETAAAPVSPQEKSQHTESEGRHIPAGKIEQCYEPMTSWETVLPRTPQQLLIGETTGGRGPSKMLMRQCKPCSQVALSPSKRGGSLHQGLNPPSRGEPSSGSKPLPKRSVAHPPDSNDSAGASAQLCHTVESRHLRKTKDVSCLLHPGSPETHTMSHCFTFIRGLHKPIKQGDATWHITSSAGSYTRATKSKHNVARRQSHAGHGRETGRSFSKQYCHRLSRQGFGSCTERSSLHASPENTGRSQGQAGLEVCLGPHDLSNM